MPRDSNTPTTAGPLDATPGPDRPLTNGTLLGGRYRIESVLGFGGMGVVYRARDLKLDCDIALKRIRPDRVSPERRETLRREIILSRRVTHENVCRVFDLVELNGEEFVSMEYLPGRTLKDVEDEQRMLPLGRGLAIAKKICRGLAAAHRIGVLHRDLKPENVIVGIDDTPRLMDFGIAVESAVYRGEKEDTVPGTPQFLAPELLRGEAPSVRTDIYAMGVLLYEMFTGQVPFDDPDTARLVRRVIAEAPPKAATLRPDLPPELLGILDRAIAKDPETRFPDADSLGDAIASFEGQVLERVLAEVSVTRAKMVKLMVILEANKALAATFDPTEILRIILKTATSETDAERGTIFLRERGADELVSQILEGGAVAPIRLPIGRGIAGTVARTGESINIADAYKDPRFDSRTDLTSGFQTRTILAAPLKTPSGEIVGVVQLLNKRNRSFTREDEEFLVEVGTHSALAVESVRQHEAAVTAARREGAARVLRSAQSLLAPHEWPATPGFETEPLRWRSEELDLVSYAVEGGSGLVSFLLVETALPVESALGALLRGITAGRERLSSSPEESVERAFDADSSCAASAARWEGDRILFAAAGPGAQIPWLLREGRPVPFPASETGRIRRAEARTQPGDILVLASAGLSAMAFPGKAVPPEISIQHFARIADASSLAGAFSQVVAEWKKAGAAGARDVLFLAARRSS
ncbi:MAG: protein kinase [Acidobacteria bacterium]|nr:protein kinase [Acidobacteriota bacterium]MCA1610214.1 protein kinase [Acidobacteriota bacterium]